MEQEFGTVRLRSGHHMPSAGFGTWNPEAGPMYEAVRHALDIGYRLFDTAPSYGTEELLGRALRDSRVPREDVFLTTKLPRGSEYGVRDSLESSLRRLGVDYVDLWLIHWPTSDGTHIETWRKLIDVKNSGRVLVAGVSNFSPRQIDELSSITGHVPEVNQVKWSPALHDPVVLEHSRASAVALQGYSPLRASNVGHSLLDRIATRSGATVPQVVLRWNLEHGITALPRSTTFAHIEENFHASDLKLTRREIAAIDRIAHAARRIRGRGGDRPVGPPN
ncbi:aldo/keto reductase [Streptomyces anulatus]|uniref:Aldo/keto reductase n=1 Tax=Streptomyces anulatus TaxID=1892 RepID=A0A7K3R3G6_STRAQ|nr:aldo/keto reductase [Streptomyces anulatus]NED27782.1 aldo/keto reductase [Streptomyces anulatus]